MYLGEITHKRRTYAGEHEAIVGEETFAAVQTALSRNRRDRGRLRASSGALLQGRLFGASGERMTPTHANKGGVRYRYYVARNLLKGSPSAPGVVSRVPAPELEGEVMRALGASGEGTGASAEIVAERLGRVVVHADRLEIHLRAGDGENEPAAPIIVPWRAPGRSRHRRIEAPSERAAQSRWAERKVIRAEARARLIEGIAKARLHVDRVLRSGEGEIARIAAEEGCSERSVRMNLNLAFLSPGLVKAAVEGTLPHRFGGVRCGDLGACWREQAEACA